MNFYMVLFRDDSLLPCDTPLGFGCHADDGNHAEEQCLNAYPDCEVVWVSLTSTYNDANALDEAYRDYWNI